MKVNMADINAAIGLAQIRQYDKLLAERKRIFKRYDEAFAACDWAILPPSKSSTFECSYHIYPLRVKGATEAQRDAIISEVARNEVAVNVHFVPLPLLTYYKELGYNIADYPKAYQHFEHEISLPVYPQLDNEKVDIVIKAVKEAYEKTFARPTR